MTPAQGRAERKALMKDIERTERARARAHMRELKAALASARKAKKGALGLARARCIAYRKALRGMLKDRRERLCAELRESSAREKLAAREACDAGLTAARTLRDKAARVAREVAHERAYREELRRIERHARERLSSVQRRRTASEAMRESDDEVRGNVAPELLALWERVKGGIRGTPRMSRTEAFLRYAEENPGEILASLEDRTDALVRELEERYARAAS